jgi:hypothetical protein
VHVFEVCYLLAAVPSSTQSLCQSHACLPAAPGGLLSVNFHRELLAMSQEVRFWELLRMNIPYVALEIQAQRDKFRVLREHALALVRDYNKVSR